MLKTNTMISIFSTGYNHSIFSHSHSHNLTNIHLCYLLTNLPYFPDTSSRCDTQEKVKKIPKSLSLTKTKPLSFRPVSKPISHLNLRAVKLKFDKSLGDYDQKDKPHSVTLASQESDLQSLKQSSPPPNYQENL
ncbi:hypothetical protein FOCC_FOCC011279 [Frankliniella occidentalis]|nr:hypothetical protein FOCC_FOCC011279 [Frankliniella occidentalis]